MKILQRWIPVIIGIVLFMESLDSTIVGVAIPTIARTFGINPINMKMALTSYLISLAIFIPISGWLADKYQAKKIFITAIVIFTFGSLFCGISPNLGFLIIARIIQGVGAAMMLPVARIILLRTHTKAELVGAFQVMVTAALLGPALGPTAGGLILAVASWHWIFLVNLPISFLCLYGVWRILPQDLTAQTPPPFDGVSFVFLGLGMASFAYALAVYSDGYGKGQDALFYAALACLGFWIYYVRTKKSDYLIFNWRLLKMRTFGLGMAANFIVRFSIAPASFLLPLLLQTVWHISPFISGLVFIPYAGGMILAKTFPLQNWLERFGVKRMILLTLVLSCFAAVIMAPFAEPRSLWLLSSVLFFQGLVASFLLGQLGTLWYLEMPAESYSQATTIMTMMQQFSGACAIALLATILFTLSQGSNEILYSSKTFFWVYLINGIYPLLAFMCILFVRADLKMPPKKLPTNAVEQKN